MGESLVVASCGCICSWGAEGPLGWLSHEVPPWLSEAAPLPTPSSRGLETLPTRHSNCILGVPGTPAPTQLFISVPSFFTNNCVHHVVPDLGSLASVPRPSRGAGLVSPAQPSSTPLFTSPLLCPRWAPPQPGPVSEGRVRLPVLPARDGYSVMAHKPLHSPS